MPKRYNLPAKYVEKFSRAVNKLNVNGIKILKSITSWNDYQKKYSKINKLTKGYTPPKNKAIKLANNISQANIRLKQINFELPVNYLINKINSWNDFQRLNKIVKNINSKHALDVVSTVNNHPIYKFQNDLLNELLPYINKRRKKYRQSLPFSFEGGTMGTAEEKMYSPKKSILDYAAPSRQDIQHYFIGLIQESYPNYYDKKELLYYENFLNAIEHIEDEKLYNNLLNKLLSYSPHELYISGVEDSLLSLENFYDMLSENSYDVKGQQLLDAL